DLAGKVLRPVVDAAVAAGCQLVHLEDPWIGYFGIDSKDWAPLREALELLHRDLRATLAFHVYFGDAGPHVDQLRRLPVDAIGVDLVETDVNELGSGWDKGLVAGVIDGRSSMLESLENTVEVARHLADTVRPRNLYLSSNCELAFLPTVVAERKVQRLGEAPRKVNSWCRYEQHTRPQGPADARDRIPGQAGLAGEGLRRPAAERSRSRGSPQLGRAAPGPELRSADRPAASRALQQRTENRSSALVQPLRAEARGGRRPRRRLRRRAAA